MHLLARAERLMAQVQRLGQHHLPAAAAVGRVIRLVVLVRRVIPDIGRPHLDQPFLLRTADDAFPHDRIDHFGKQRHNVCLLYTSRCV